MDRRRLGRLLVGVLAVGGWVAAPLVVAVVPAAPAGAITVSTEAQFRAAYTDGTQTTIDLTASVNLTCPGGTPTRLSGAAALTVNGHGFTINQSCASLNVLDSTNGALTLNGVTLTDTGGGSGATGVNAASAGVTLLNSTISGMGGDGVFAGDNVSLTNSTISGSGADGIQSGNNVSVTSSTISGNGTNGIDSGNNVSVKDSTISDNGAEGLRVISATLIYATVVQNATDNISAGSGLTSFASVLALSHPNCNVSGTVTNGFNFSDDTTCGFTQTSDNQNGANPMLGPLANNGGPTQTRLPQSGSPLIDVLPKYACQSDGAGGIGTDQRGVGRPQGPDCDPGAVEVSAVTPASPVTSTPTPPAPLTVMPTFTG
jgi:hypothetical protein